MKLKFSLPLILLVITGLGIYRYGYSQAPTIPNGAVPIYNQNTGAQWGLLPSYGGGSFFQTTNSTGGTTSAGDCAGYDANGALQDVGNCGAGNATKLQGRNVDPTAPSDQQVLTWVAGTQKWTPVNAAGGGGGASLGYVSTTFSATPTFTPNPVGSCTFEITLTGNVSSSSFTSGGLTAGTLFIFIIHQDATGGRTFVWPTTAKGAMPIGTTASQTTVQSYVWNGANLVPSGGPEIY